MPSEAFLKALSFLDVQTGLLYSGESPELYREILTTYLHCSKWDLLTEAFAAEDWNQYRIEIHALKSTSMAIGAVEFSDRCKALEQAAKDWNLPYIRAEHRPTMQAYGELMQQIAVVLEGEDHCRTCSGVPLYSPVNADVLLVDDDEVSRKTAKLILQKDYTTACAASGPEAFRYLETSLPKLILLDLHMPGMDGFEVMRKLGEDPRTHSLPVIFLTADRDIGAELKGFQMGAMDFITKPFVEEIMLHRISRIMELDRLQKHLQQEVQRQTQKAEERKLKLERITHQVIQALSGTVDAKDRYTNGHSLRVAKYAREIAARMGMNRQEQENIYYIGMLHDIGKIGIPDEIINKPGRLSREEYERVKTHPAIGSEILKNVSEIPGLCLGTRGHHERYDGTGYPDGLAGEAIPIQARIIAVADAYDAMTSCRSYRSPLPQAAVRRELERGKGSQFDPRIADLMLQMIDEDSGYTMREQV